MRESKGARTSRPASVGYITPRKKVKSPENAKREKDSLTQYFIPRGGNDIA